jgi:hypothetical protein
MTLMQFRLTDWAMMLAAAYTMAGCIVADADDSVMPKFDCDNRNGDAMLPDTTLIRNLGTETRTMTGQFGDPDQGHSVTFTLTYDDINGNEYQSVGSITDYGRTSITAEFDVGEATCDTGGMGPNEERHDCDVPYRLDVMVDGERLCSKNNFGNIHTYWR